MDGRRINTRIAYQYRDAANWKKEGRWILAGKASPGEVAAISEALDDQGFFVPHAVGMPMLAPYGGTWCEDDHPYHRIVSVEHTHEPADGAVSFAEMVAMFRKQGDWIEAARKATEELDDSTEAPGEEPDEADGTPMPVHAS